MPVVSSKVYFPLEESSLNSKRFLSRLLENSRHSIGMVKLRRGVPSVLTPEELVRAEWPLPAKT